MACLALSWNVPLKDSELAKGLISATPELVGRSEWRLIEDQSRTLCKVIGYDPVVWVYLGLPN